MDYSIIKDRINYLYERSGKSISGLSDDLGLPPATLSRWLAGKRVPTLDKIIVVSDHFRVSVDWLLGLEDGRESIRDEMHEIAHLYSISTQDDRKIIHAVLDKYRSKEEPSDGTQSV